MKLFKTYIKPGLPEEDNCESIIKIIRNHARTGGRGDGVLFVSPIDQAERIRDGLKGHDVLN